MNGYDNFFLPVDDMAMGVDYYSNILGLRIKFDFSKIGLVAFSVGNEEPAIILKDAGMHRNVKPTIWFVVDDVTAEYEKLISKGVKFISEPFRINTGIAAEFDDVFGNRLGITDYSLSTNS